jgi:hypothetical protein
MAVDVSGLGNTVVWPGADMTVPLEVEHKADYYDSIFHSSAVVGVNTSAMIEASIIGRPVLAVLEPEFHDSQLGTFHFSYLLESSGGAVRVARSVQESFAELSAILAGRAGDDSARARRFVTDFVRPHGIERPATPIFVETLEQLATTSVKPERDPLWAVAARGLVVPSLWLGVIVAGGVRRLVPPRLREALTASMRPIRKFLRARARTWVKRIRRFVLVWLRAAVSVRVQRLRG